MGVWPVARFLLGTNMKTLLAFLPPFLAATDGITHFEWGTVSATGLLGWYLWYTTKVVMPRHQDQISSMQNHFSEQILTQRDHYEKLLDEQQDRHEARHNQIVEALEKLVDKLEE